MSFQNQSYCRWGCVLGAILLSLVDLGIAVEEQGLSEVNPDAEDDVDGADLKVLTERF